MVREVTLDKKGKASGVIYIDKVTKREKRAKARVVVVAASAAESSRIFLNSRSNLFPDGLANDNGLVGKYLMDTVGAGVGAQIPALESLPPHNEDGASAMLCTSRGGIIRRNRERARLRSRLSHRAVRWPPYARSRAISRFRELYWWSLRH